jgi:hypothetical protein
MVFYHCWQANRLAFEGPNQFSESTSFGFQDMLIHHARRARIVNRRNLLGRQIIGADKIKTNADLARVEHRENHFEAISEKHEIGLCFGYAINFNSLNAVAASTKSCLS